MAIVFAQAIVPDLEPVAFVGAPVEGIDLPGESPGIDHVLGDDADQFARPGEGFVPQLQVHESGGVPAVPGDIEIIPGSPDQEWDCPLPRGR